MHRPLLSHLFSKTRASSHPFFLFCIFASIFTQQWFIVNICMLFKILSLKIIGVFLAFQYSLLILFTLVAAVVEAMAPVDALSWFLPFLLRLEHSDFFAPFFDALFAFPNISSTYLHFLRPCPTAIVSAWQHLNCPICPRSPPTNSLNCSKCTLTTAHEMKVKVEKLVWLCRSGRVDGEFQEHIILGDRQAGRQTCKQGDGRAKILWFV